jgi:hypothetical protein
MLKRRKIALQSIILMCIKLLMTCSNYMFSFKIFPNILFSLPWLDIINFFSYMWGGKIHLQYPFASLAAWCSYPMLRTLHLKFPIPCSQASTSKTEWLHDIWVIFLYPNKSCVIVVMLLFVLCCYDCRESYCLKISSFISSNV